MTIQSRMISCALSLMASAVFVAAQSPKNGNTQTQPTSAVENGSDLSRDGLQGPVRRIRTEVVKVVSADGKITENGKRVLLETAEYDLKGTKTVNQYFPVAGSAPTGREVYKYDDKGNISEMTLSGTDGSLVSKETYKYEYDSLGNWTKMTTSVAVVENGAISFEPTEVTYRTISYYLNAAMSNLLQPTNNNTPAKTTGSVATNNVATNPKSASQQPGVTPFQYKRRSPVTLTGQSGLPMADVRNASFVTENKVAVDNAPPPPTQRERAPISGGVLNGSAINLPMPFYPNNARNARVEGVVEVEVIIDESGKVVSAKAISGPMLLRDNAAKAALQARFTPSKLSGQPVKVSGKIIYNFKLAR